MSAFRRICFIGFDRVIGSLALGLKRTGFRGPMLGVGDPSTIDQCWKLGIISDGYQELEKAVVGADLIVLSSRAGHASDMLENVLNLADEEAVISEMTRVKRDVNRVFEQSSRTDVHYVGFRLLGDVPNEDDFSRADKFFFERRSVILTPRGKADLNAFSKLQDALKKMGASVIAMSPQAHDRILSQISQVPHAAIAAMLRRIFESEDVEITADMLGKWLTNELQDIAALKQSGWLRDIADNVELVQQGLDDLIKQIERVKGEIAAGTFGQALDDLLARTGSVLHTAVAAEKAELILTAAGDTKAAEKAANILAKARIPIRTLEKIEHAEPGTFRLCLNSTEERDRAASLLQSAGLEAVTLS
jgi:prephenate dehydrogenase